MTIIWLAGVLFLTLALNTSILLIFYISLDLFTIYFPHLVYVELPLCVVDTVKLSRILFVLFLPKQAVIDKMDIVFSQENTYLNAKGS